MISQIELSSIANFLFDIDSTRFSEIELYLKNLNFINFFLGYGFGAGFEDTELLIPLTYENYMGNFSLSEIEANNFFNFHGFYIEFLIRFGFLFCFFLFTNLFKLFDKLDDTKKHLSIIVFSLLIIGYFNIKTVFIILFFAINLKKISKNV